MGKQWWLGICLGAVAMAALIVGVSSAGQEPLLPPPERETVEAEEFPCLLGDCGLVAEILLNYEGVFREDGSNEMVTGVAGLVVYNPGMQGVQAAELVVSQEGRQLDFKVTYLPADSRCLVLESSGQLYSGEMVTGCGYKSITWGEFGDQTTEVEISRGETVMVENRTDKVLKTVTLYYKLYMPRERYYLGGVTYCITVKDLQPGEKRELPFAQLGYGSVVAVK